MGKNRIGASHANLHELASSLQLDDVAYRRALEIAGLVPNRADWLRYIDRFLTAIGVLLIVSGIAAFFASNWAELGHFTKFGLIQIGILMAILATWRLGIDSIAGQASLLAAGCLVGVLLAVFGQVYQTGADPYGLFLAWALFVVPWAIIGRQAGLWILFQVLVNLTLIMYWTQVLHPPEGWWLLAQLLGPLVWLSTSVMDWRLASYLFALNASALVIWEVLAASGIGWMRGRWFPRGAAVAAFATVVPPTLMMLFAAAFEAKLALSVVSPALFAVTAAACLYYYQYRRPDLFILTVCLMTGIMVVTAICIRYLFADFGSALFLALLLIGQVAGGAYWLRHVARRWEQDA